MKIIKNLSLARYTTLKTGGRAKYFAEVKNLNDIKRLVDWAEENGCPFLFIGSGSNLLVSSKGFDGLIIKNSAQKIKVAGNTITVSAGVLLQDFVDRANQEGFAGIEKLTGIPGTVGGAVYGNAGAYGQTISDHLVSVLVLDDGETVELPKSKCGFEYRSSRFKSDKGLIILEATFALQKADSFELAKTSEEILQLRLQKYPEGLKSPGSFFKNVPVDKISKRALKKIPADKVMFGKVPAGYLLEAVGARGAKLGGAKIADYHGNLFLNEGEATPEDFYKLARKYKSAVKKKFGIALEPEVQLVGFSSEL